MHKCSCHCHITCSDVCIGGTVIIAVSMLSKLHALLQPSSADACVYLQVVAIVTAGAPSKAGLFFPNGLNGNIKG